MNDGTGLLYDLQGHSLFTRYVTTAFATSGAGVRGKVHYFSCKAVSRMRRYLRTSTANYTVLITLTYPAEFPSNGRKVKQHLCAFAKRAIRNSKNRETFSLFWFIEFQDRGAPHFHLFSNEWMDKASVAKDWYECVGSGDDQHLCAGTRVEGLYSSRYGCCAYAAKYAAKHTQKEVPSTYQDVGRFWGVYGSRECSSASIFVPRCMLAHPYHQQFRQRLVNLFRKNRVKWRKMTIPGNTRGIFINDMDFVNQVKWLLHEYGVLFQLHDIADFEYPLRDIDEAGE